MKVFLSWSGDLSRMVAVLLRKYIPCVLQGVDAFMSKHDLASGARWNLELAKQLEDSSFGILCLTPENLSSEWLLFEAGALTKHIEGRACGVLIGGLRPTDVRGPLSQFQHRTFGRDDIEALLRDVNGRLERPLEPDSLKLIIEKWWPDMERDYGSALETTATQTTRIPRNQQDILEEILTRVRSLERSIDKPHVDMSLVDMVVQSVRKLTKPQRGLLVEIAKNSLEGRKTPIEKYPRDDVEALEDVGMVIIDNGGALIIHSKIAEALTTPLSELFPN